MGTAKKKSIPAVCNMQNSFIQVRGTVIKRTALEAVQEKIITFAAAQVGKNDDANQRYTIAIKDFADMCNIAPTSRNGEYYDHVFNAVYDLKTRAVAFLDADSGDDIIESYIEGIRLNRKSGTISFKIPETILPFYKALNQYSKIELLDYMPIKGKYALRLYQLMFSWVKRGQIEYALEELREKLGLMYNQYPRTVDFMRFVLEPSVKEINSKSQQIRISYENKVGQRRKIEGFFFKIKQVKSVVATQQEQVATIAPICPKCGAVVIKKHGKNGEFWGCSNFKKTNCRYSSDTDPRLDTQSFNIKLTVLEQERLSKIEETATVEPIEPGEISKKFPHLLKGKS